MLLHNFLEESARTAPDKCALVCGGERLSYREVNALADKLAYALRREGVRRGDRVAIFLENSIESVVSVFGVLKADGVFVMLSPTLKSEKFGYILNHCGVRALIADPRRIGSNADVLNRSPHLGLVVHTRGEVRGKTDRKMLPWEEIIRESIPEGSAPKSSNIDLDLAAIIYTSGSTSDPKGVMLTHLNMISAATSITTYLENRADDVILNVLPLSFDYGLYQVLMAFKFGGTVVLEKTFAYPYQILKRIREEGVTGFPGVPTIFAILLQMEDIRAQDLSSLRYVTNTAAALPVDHIRKLRRIFPNARLYSMYGLTECKRVSYLHPDDLEKRPGSVGKAMPNEEVWIVDEYGNKVEPGVIGELVVRGANVMRGYWADREATDAVLKPGPLPGERVLYTGDLFRMDEEGYLYFVGRRDDMIKTRGERVSPKEVENALYALDGILETAVVPVPDGILGNSIKAFIVPQKGCELSEREVLRHCRRVLEDFAVPRHIEFRDHLPKNASGKIDKLALKGHSP